MPFQEKHCDAGHRKMPGACVNYTQHSVRPAGTKGTLMTLCKKIPVLCILFFSVLLLCFGTAYAKKDPSPRSRTVSTGKLKTAAKWFRFLDEPAFAETSSRTRGVTGFLEQDEQRTRVRPPRKVAFTPVFEQVVKGAMLSFSW